MTQPGHSNLLINLVRLRPRNAYDDQASLNGENSLAKEPLKHLDRERDVLVRPVLGDAKNEPAALQQFKASGRLSWIFEFDDVGNDLSLVRQHWKSLQ